MKQNWCCNATARAQNNGFIFLLKAVYKIGENKWSHWTAAKAETTRKPTVGKSFPKSGRGGASGHLVENALLRYPSVQNFIPTCNFVIHSDSQDQWRCQHYLNYGFEWIILKWRTWKHFNTALLIDSKIFFGIFSKIFAYEFTLRCGSVITDFHP